MKRAFLEFFSAYVPHGAADAPATSEAQLALDGVVERLAERGPDRHLRKGLFPPSACLLLIPPNASATCVDWRLDSNLWGVPVTKTWAKAPTPCVSICKFDDDGLCIGCAMTRREKKAVKRMDKKSVKRPYFQLLMARLESLGRLAYWTRMYRRKCERKEAACPLDNLAPRSKL
jgi:predicted Fe-S protein YdhL (DUF1289 family)